MKFNTNTEYYISLLFFLIIHAKSITSSKIKTLGVPQHLNFTEGNINKSNLILSQNGLLDIVKEKNDLDMYNNTYIQNSFLEIKSILDKELITKPSSSYINDIRKTINKNTLGPQKKINLKINNKDNNKIENRILVQSEFTNSDLLKSVPEDELVLKLKELEAKLRENYQMEEEKNQVEQVFSIADIKNSKMKKNKTFDYKRNQNEQIEVNNSFSDELNIEEFFNIRSEKRKYLEEHNVFMFYNSLSLVMLSMLGGGVIGIIFILYFSYKDENHKL